MDTRQLPVLGTLAEGAKGGAAPGHLPIDDSRVSWIALAVLFTVYLFSSIDRSVFSIVAQPIKEELLLADWQLGFLSGFAYGLLYLTFGLVMARLADQGNRVTILSVCIAFWSVMTALCGLSVNFIQLCLFRMGVGVGEAACLPASHSLISDYFPTKTRTTALAIYGLGYPLGGLVGTVIGGIVVDHWGWRAAFYVIGVPGILVALLTWCMVKEPQRGRFDAGTANDPQFSRPKSFREVLHSLWESPVLRQMILAVTLLSFTTSPTAAFLGPFLIRKFPISYTELGFIVAGAMMLGSSISTVLGGIIAQRLARRDQRWLVWFPAAAVAIGMPLYVFALVQASWVKLAAWMFFGALMNAAYLAPCFAVLYSEIAPGGRAKAAVIMQICIGLIGQSFGPLLAGVANDAVAAFLFRNHTALGFMATCPGGQAAKGASAVLDAACRGAVVDATQIVLVVSMAMTIWPVWHFYLAGRHMKRRALSG